MFCIKRKYLFIPILVVTLVAALCLVRPVYADDGSTGSDQGAIATDQGTATDTAVPDQASATPAPTDDPALVTETTAPDEGTMVPDQGTAQATESPVVTETTVPDVGTIVPDQGTPTEVVTDTAPGEGGVIAALNDSGVQVVDSSGAALPPATRTTDDLVANGDPYFTVGAVTYHFLPWGSSCAGVPGVCVISHTPIQAALNYMAANNLVPTDHKLYIEPQAPAYDEDVEVNGALNGVKGLTGITGNGATPDDVLITGYLWIHDMPAGFAVTNLSVDDVYYNNDAAIWANNNKGTLTFTDVNATSNHQDSSGIVLLNNTGAVVMNRVNASNNAYKGVDIYNQTGPVTITNSTFDHNLLNVNDGVPYEGSVPYYAGLRISLLSNGAVTLTGVHASLNVGDGVHINAGASAVTIKNSEFTWNDSTHVHPSWGDGLYVAANTVTLQNVTSNDNDYYGIQAYVNTSFTATNLMTIGNSSTGLYVSGCNGTACVYTTGAGTVTINGIESSFNSGNGVYIITKGAITVNQATTTYNSDYGLYLSNSDPTSAVPVTVNTATSSVNFYGVVIMTRGAVNLTNIVADYNSIDGIYVHEFGTAAVNLTINTANPTVFNETAHNGNDGVNIVTLGSVTITGLNSYNNTLKGVFIDGSAATTANTVTIKVLDAANTNNQFYNNGTRGLDISVHGAVTISNVNAYSNVGYGANITNLPVSGSGAAVTINNSSFNSNCSPLGACTHVSHSSDGLDVYSKGTVTLNNVTANGNDGWGVYIYNAYTGATAGVNINATATTQNNFNGNYLIGLDVYTNGAVTITNITANSNKGSYGVRINNTGGTGAVTLKQVLSSTSTFKGNAFDSNTQTGLYIYTKGTVTVAFNEANGNGNYGIEVDNSTGTAPVTVTGNVNPYDNVYDNGLTGVYLTSKGTISLVNVDAVSNGVYGAYLYNTGGTGSVVLTNASFDANVEGLLVSTNGALTWKNGSATDNTSFGANLTARGAVVLTNVTSAFNSTYGIKLTDQSTVTFTQVTSYFNFSGNGIEISTTGNVVFTQVSAFANSGTGAYVVSTTGTFTLNKPSTGAMNQFDSNGGDGLYVNLLGKVTLTNIEASGNSGDGIDLAVTIPAGTSPIVITNATTNNNVVDGIYIYTTGAVTVNKWVAKDNSLYGGHIIQTSAPSSAFAVSVSNFDVEDSTSTGLWIEAKGNVTLSKFIANNNGADGINVKNTYGTGNVTILNPAGGAYFNQANSKGSNGVEILSYGTISVTGLNTYSNSQNGLKAINDGSSTNAPITLTSVIARYNNYDGVLLSTKGTATVTSSWAYSNHYNGMDLYAPTTINITSSGSIDNYWRGIYAGMGGSGKVNLTGSTWFGNLQSDPFPADTNLDITGGVAVIK
jgi:hypothetical protein